MMEIMKEILNKNESLKPLKIGQIIEGRVIGKNPMAVFLDLGIYGTGIIYGKEFKDKKEDLKKLKIGDKILAKVIDLDNEEGYIELSVSGASKEIALQMLKQKKEAGEKIKVKILGVNKGGLLTKISGVSGFLPISQLSQENLSTIESSNPEEILTKLKNFIGKEMEVKILAILEDNQVILSEKLAKEKEIQKYNVGEVIEGEVSAIVDYGIFLKFGEDLEGLIPISEISSISDFKIGQKLKAKIEKIEDKKIFLSLKL